MGCCASMHLALDESQLTIKQYFQSDQNKLNQKIVIDEICLHSKIQYQDDGNMRERCQYELDSIESLDDQNNVKQQKIFEEKINNIVEKPGKFSTYSQYHTSSQTPPQSRRETIQINQELLKYQNQSVDQNSFLDNSKNDDKNGNNNFLENNHANQVENLIKRQKKEYQSKKQQQQQPNQQHQNQPQNQNINQTPIKLNLKNLEINTIQEENSQLFMNSPRSPFSKNSENDLTYRSINEDDNNNISRISCQKQHYPIQIVKISQQRKKYPPIQLHDGTIYEGEWKNGKQDGQGISQYTDQSIHEGEYCDGQAQGKGILTFYDGQYYIGEFMNNKQHGQGKYVQYDMEYVGQWVHGKQEGRGVEIWGEKKDNRYEGMYVGGKRHGKGKLIIKNCFMYVGDFIDSEMHGFGKINFNDDRIYEGQIEQNKMHGKGKLQFLYQKEYYIGEFNQDNMEGIGTYYYNDKSKYIGGWLNNKQHGQGLLINSKGESLKGVWNNGECMQKKINLSYKKSLIKSYNQSSISSMQKFRNIDQNITSLRKSKQSSFNLL